MQKESRNLVGNLPINSQINQLFLFIFFSSCCNHYRIKLTGYIVSWGKGLDLWLRAQRCWSSSDRDGISPLIDCNMNPGALQKCGLWTTSDKTSERLFTTRGIDRSCSVLLLSPTYSSQLSKRHGTDPRICHFNSILYYTLSCLSESKTLIAYLWSSRLSFW